LLVVAVAASCATLLRGASVPKVIAIVGASAPAVVCARVVVEAVLDPTSHNLWPFEVVIALVIGLICASVGAIPGAPIAWGSRCT
jgi:hypothetical protein